MQSSVTGGSTRRETLICSLRSLSQRIPIHNKMCRLLLPLSYSTETLRTWQESNLFRAWLILMMTINLPLKIYQMQHPTSILSAFSMYGSTVGSAFEDNKIMGFRKLISLFLWIQQKTIFTGNCLNDCFQLTMETVLLEETNQSIEGEPVTYGELLHWIGLWIIMSTCDGSDCRSFWSNKNPDIFDGHHFRLQQFMTRYWFEGILTAIKYTNNNPPAYKDRFWGMCQLLESWNNNMATNFIPLWINAIDESMS